LPVSEGLTVAGYLLGIVGLVFAFRLVLTIWHAIPFKAS
jgi:hypothetical protein